MNKKNHLIVEQIVGEAPVKFSPRDDLKKLWDVEDDAEEYDRDQVDTEPSPSLYSGLDGEAYTKISLNTEICSTCYHSRSSYNYIVWIE